MPESEPAGDELSTPAEKKLFEKYQVGRLLGYGAFAKVYYARELHTEHSVAVKVINKQRIIKEGLVANVKREIAIMRRLRHPNIVRLIEVLANKKKIYFVMDFAKGGELFVKVEKSRFSEDLSRKYFQQLISAVGYCHSRGVFHRDLKPENLLLDENWNLKITDFGLSALKDQIRPDGLLHTLCGTPSYVAPEILSKKGYDGAKIDIWSCGIILFVLNAGYLPFNDSNLMKMYRKIYTGEFRVPRWTSPELKRLISRLLDTNPVTRITVDEIINDPWFKIGYKEVKFYHDYLELKTEDDGDYNGDGDVDGDGDGDDDSSTSTSSSGNNLNLKAVNAFDIISFSSGYNLSGLFNDLEISERFLSMASPEKIIETVVMVAEGEQLTVVARKDWCVKVVGGQNCNFTMVIELKRLTEEIVVVEVTVKEIEVGPSNRIWEEKIRPGLDDIVYKTEPAGCR